MTIEKVSTVISAAGVYMPTFQDVLDKLIADFQSIYGGDIYIAPDSQDGQMLASLALAITNANFAVVSVYNAYSPETAQGGSLTSLAKLNGVVRDQPRQSFATGCVANGVPGTVILGNSLIKDTSGFIWKITGGSHTLDATGTSSGIFVTCQTTGHITADANTINIIVTPITGWYSFTNPTQANPAPGDAISSETDPVLRVRRNNCAAGLVRNRIVDNIAEYLAANVGFAFGSTGVRVYENCTNSTDANGIPSGNVCVVIGPASISSSLVDGSVAGWIDTIVPYGTPRYGGTSPSTSSAIPFFYATAATTAANITVKQIVNGVPVTSGSLPAPTLSAIQAAIQAAINATPLGLGAVSYFSVAAAASLSGTTLFGTFEVSALTLNKNGGSFAAADIALTFLEQVSAGTVTVTVA